MTVNRSPEVVAVLAGWRLGQTSEAHDGRPAFLHRFGEQGVGSFGEFGGLFALERNEHLRLDVREQAVSAQLGRYISEVQQVDPIFSIPAQPVGNLL